MQRRVQVFVDFIRSGQRDQQLRELDEGLSSRVSNSHVPYLCALFLFGHDHDVTLLLAFTFFISFLSL